MDGITVVFAVVAGLLVFAIAAAVVGREAHRLDAVAPRAVYQLDEAVDFVCDRLPVESQARLTPGEVGMFMVAATLIGFATPCIPRGNPAFTRLPLYLAPTLQEVMENGLGANLAPPGG